MRSKLLFAFVALGSAGFAEAQEYWQFGKPMRMYGVIPIEVTDPMTDETARVAVLSDGDAFGEEALLLEGNRTATVRMNSPGRLLVLKQSDFDELLRPEMVERVDAARARDMLEAGQAQLIDCRYQAEYEEGRIPGALATYRCPSLPKGTWASTVGSNGYFDYSSFTSFSGAKMYAPAGTPEAGMNAHT